MFLSFFRYVIEENEWKIYQDLLMCIAKMNVPSRHMFDMCDGLAMERL